MTYLKALFLTVFTFAVAYVTLAALMANGLASFDCEQSASACDAAELRGAALIFVCAVMLWTGVGWLVLRDWSRR